MSEYTLLCIWIGFLVIGFFCVAIGGLPEEENKVDKGDRKG
jgi:hypothetical protein